VGADVLPWLPIRGIYLLIEQGQAATGELTAVPGVAGTWAGDSAATRFSSAGSGQKLTLCFLDGDPVETARRLNPLLEERWQAPDLNPLFAAPFYSVVPYEWGRYLP
jgi:hypothetical protein